MAYSAWKEQSLDLLRTEKRCNSQGRQPAWKSNSLNSSTAHRDRDKELTLALLMVNENTSASTRNSFTKVGMQGEERYSEIWIRKFVETPSFYQRSLNGTWRSKSACHYVGSDVTGTSCVWQRQVMQKHRKRMSFEVHLNSRPSGGLEEVHFHSSWERWSMGTTRSVILTFSVVGHCWGLGSGLRRPKMISIRQTRFATDTA